MIIESADPGQFVSLDVAENVAREFRRLTGAPGIAQLNKLTMQQMLRGQARLWAKGFDAALSSMVNDGSVFHRTPIEELGVDATASKPMISGSNAEEMHYFDALEDQAQIFSLSEAQLRDWLSHLFGAAGPSILDVYQRQNPDWHEAVSELAGDAVFRMPSVRAAQINSTRQPTYMYQFSYRSPTLGPTGKQYGALHGLEVAFVFRLDTSKGYTYVGPKGSWQRLSDQMSDAWIRFARSGDPNGEGLPAWPRYNAQQRYTMDFNFRSEVLLDPKSAERRAWDAVASKRFESGEVVHLGD